DVPELTETPPDVVHPDALSEQFPRWSKGADPPPASASAGSLLLSPSSLRNSSVGRLRPRRQQCRDAGLEVVHFRFGPAEPAGTQNLFDTLRTHDQRVDAICRERQLSVAKGPEIVLQLVGELLDRTHLHHRGNAFQGMKVSEKLVDRFAFDTRVPDR